MPQQGLRTPGNIDLYNRPVVKNPAGGNSTVYSMSFGREDGMEVLIPRVSNDGRILSEDEAINEYYKTGKHLGVFDTPSNATKYAQQLHSDYEAGKYGQAINGRLRMPQQLSEERRVQLDGIVQKMLANKEPDDNIQWVVNDFKQKYGAQPQPPTSPTLIESRKAASKGAFEDINRQSTLKSRTREAAIGLFEPFAAQNIAGMAESLYGAASDMLSGKGTARAQGLLRGMITAPVAPIQNLYQGFKEGDYDKAGYGAGGFASQTVPAIEGAVSLAQAARGALARTNAPTALMERAAANRAPYTLKGNQVVSDIGAAAAGEAALQAMIHAPLGTGAAVAEAVQLIRRNPVYRGLKASAQESLAKWIANGRKGPSPVSPTILDASTKELSQAPDLPTEPTDFAPRLQYTESRGPMQVRQAPDLPTDTGMNDVYGMQFREKPTGSGYVEGSERIQLGEATKPNPSIDLQRIEKGLTGGKGAASESRGAAIQKTAARLYAIAPELATKIGKAFDDTLKNYFAKAEQDVIAAENQVPSDFIVDRTSIIDEWENLAKEYESKNLPHTAAKIRNLAESLQENAPAQIPWNQFIKIKRSFFKENSINMMPMRRAYSVLMRAAEPASADLATANASYSVFIDGMKQAGMVFERTPEGLFKAARRKGEIGKAAPPMKTSGSKYKPGQYIQ